MTISCIVAVAHNNVIGKDNDIPWYLPADLKYFKRTTIHHPVIMGRNCFASIGRALPKRTNIVVTRDPFFIASDSLTAHSIEESLSLAQDTGAEECFIIGGGKIYEQTVDLWDKLYLTEVDVEVDGDVFFPQINYDQWDLLQSENHLPDEKNEYHYCFKEYVRKSPKD
ncbi:MAG TPA: dihydrofolate reductase [Saprospiraceae bacterium]|nr:dihydrofolate reductase [Saprospiraceae bacterium]